MKAQHTSSTQTPIHATVRKSLRLEDSEVVKRFYQNVLKGFGHHQGLKKVG
jgi:hypothetical protein